MTQYTSRPGTHPAPAGGGSTELRRAPKRRDPWSILLPRLLPSFLMDTPREYTHDEGPAQKVSISMPASRIAAVRARVGARGFSAYVSGCRRAPDTA